MLLEEETFGNIDVLKTPGNLLGVSKYTSDSMHGVGGKGTSGQASAREKKKLKYQRKGRKGSRF